MTDTHTTLGVPGAFYCDQCGARYPADGLCDNQHPATPLQPVEDE